MSLLNRAPPIPPTPACACAMASVCIFFWWCLSVVSVRVVIVMSPLHLRWEVLRHLKWSILHSQRAQRGFDIAQILRETQADDSQKGSLIFCDSCCCRLFCSNAQFHFPSAHFYFVWARDAPLNTLVGHTGKGQLPSQIGAATEGSERTTTCKSDRMQPIRMVHPTRPILGSWGSKGAGNQRYDLHVWLQGWKGRPPHQREQKHKETLRNCQ